VLRNEPGSGIDKIKAGWNSQHWRLPIVKEQMHPDRVHWILPMVSLIPETVLHKLKSRFADKFAKFNNVEVQALVTADIEGYVDNVRMRQLTGLHAADITKILQALVSQGALCQNGQGRWTQYSLPPDNDSLHLGSDSLHLGPDSLHLGSESVQIEELWTTLKNIASSARTSKRLNYKQMEAIILKICQDHWLTRRQIAECVNRNHASILKRFLTPMVEHGLLELRYPDKPNRIDQAYRVPRTVSPIQKSHD